MLLLGNLLGIFAHVFDTFLFVYLIIVFISVILSWVGPDPYNPVVRFLRGVTEPLFLQVRRLAPFPLIGGIDFSPVAILLGLQIVSVYVTATLGKWAVMLKLVARGIPQ